MIVVADTSPLIALRRVDRLHLLKDLFGEVFIPQGVAEELSKGESSIVVKEPWIKEKKVKEQLALEILTLFLDRGEAEAIILAKEISADRLIIDEKAGRDIAKRLKIKKIGTLGVLLLAKEEGMIAKVKHVIEGLKESNFWLSEELEKQVLVKAGEK